MIYIEINVDPKKSMGKSESIFTKFLSIILPKANPDYDEGIPLVHKWLLEFEDVNSTPSREIGLNSENIVIMKMPYKSNYGYWIDNSLSINDFKKSFDVKSIEEKYFNDKWGDISG